MINSTHPDKNTEISTLVTCDTGLGTTYERWALNRYLTKIAREKGIMRVFEGPDDGMTGISGINSLALCLQGAQVTLVLPDEDRIDFALKVWAKYLPKSSPRLGVINNHHFPFPDKEFDLVWNFNVLTRLPDVRAQLEEMVRISKQYVLVFVPNCQNYSFPIHRFHHRWARVEWDHGQISLMKPDPWKKMLHDMGLQIVETVWLDCPWWPDIVDMGALISDIFPFTQRWANRLKPQYRCTWSADNLPYFDPEHWHSIDQSMQRLAYFENSSNPWLKKIFAHHV